MKVHQLFLAAAACSAAVVEYGDDEPSYFYDISAGSQLPIHLPVQSAAEPPGAPVLKSIYETISGSPEFTKLTKALEFDEEMLKVLNDSSSSLTFFAVPDWALKEPKDKHPHEDDFESLIDNSSGFYNLEAVVSMLDTGESSPGDDEDKEKRKKFLKKILHAILSYHILPDALTQSELAANITYATSLELPDGSLDGKPLRIHVEKRGPIASPLKVNFFNTLTLETKASNGIAHTISRPLLPPPSIFQEAFLLYQAFSTYTSVIQRVGLVEELDLRYKPGKKGEKGTLEGAPVVTSFIPINKAFNKLPLKLRLFLFSPFGEHVLKKILQYHTVPELLIHSDYLYNSTSGEEIELTNLPSLEGFDFEHGCDHDEFHLERHFEPLFDPKVKYATSHAMPRPYRRIGLDTSSGLPRSPFPKPELIFASNITVPTLFGNHTLDLTIVKYKLTVPFPGPDPHSLFIHRVFVNGQRAVLTDVPSRNGAAHVLARLINPHKNKKHGPPDHAHVAHDDENEWVGWEEWLPKWADEEDLADEDST
ncbi:hypothetical protein PC9H_001196 [Pleurotus ostreatus]|uniref:FAS1 domain-containing protein n=1 Tax=Pleurotus ostreatus TaxID=5322 RepID=A0A8H7A2M0_PLEOS|nr:uncharacterized protein PC9H_001196 [Pleurotus ostreatus]KAF7440848.1 hypothetical protein PC9H_001196 [Pleurotus ostreatus]